MAYHITLKVVDSYVYFQKCLSVYFKGGILKLSGGQQQRVAIARALSYEPDIIFADEPTGNLDIDTQNDIMKILRTLANEGKCVIIVTHSPEVSKQSDVVYELKSGK